MKRELDHCGVAVKDLDRGRDAYAKLGFQLTARSFHSGAVTAGGPVVPWGSGNHCAMFRDGYLEVIGLTDASMYSSVKDMVAKYEGMHIVALRCGEADAAYAEFQAKGLPIEPPRALERDAAFGPGNKETRRAKFRNMYINRQTVTEARFIYLEHLTEDVLWQPHLLDHPNGALGLDAVYFVVADPEETAKKFAPLFSDRIERFPGVVKLSLDRGTMWLTQEAEWRKRVPGGFVPPVPSPAGFGIRVASIEATRKYLASQGVPVQAGMSASQLWVAPEHACGAAIQFMQAESTK
jgi:catechol 2,3-dioxygenase-like lactoylglutathione lyase family enzyme